MGVVGRDLRQWLGWGVGLEAEAADDPKHVGGLLGGVLGPDHGGPEGPDDALGVGSADGVDGPIGLVLGEPRRGMGAENLRGPPQRRRHFRLEVGLVSEEVPPLDDVGAGDLPGVEGAAVGVLVQHPGRIEPVRRACPVKAGQRLGNHHGPGCLAATALALPIAGLHVAEQRLGPVTHLDAEQVARRAIGPGDGHARPGAPRQCLDLVAIALLHRPAQFLAVFLTGEDAPGGAAPLEQSGVLPADALDLLAGLREADVAADLFG